MSDDRTLLDARIHRALVGDASEAERADLDRLRVESPEAAARFDAFEADEAALRTLTEPTPPKGLTGAIMAGLRAEGAAVEAADGRYRSAWRPIAAAASIAFAAGALAGWQLGPRERLQPLSSALSAQADRTLDCPTAPVNAIADTAPEERVPVRFVYVSKDAREVRLVGDFDGWGERRIRLDRSPVQGVYEATVMLPPGEHQYMFVIDGERWVADPLARRTRSDGFGMENSVVEIGG